MEQKKKKLKDYKSNINPFLYNSPDILIKGSKKIKFFKNNLKITDCDDNQICGAGIHITETVDAEKFLKLYFAGVKALCGLNNFGLKLFEFLYHSASSKIDQGVIYLKWDQEKQKMSKATYYKGIMNLVENNFISPCNDQNLYFINLNYLFNGDRFTFIKTYQKDQNL